MERECKRDIDSSNPLHQHDDGKWYWCDECWTTCYGPYDTKTEAEDDLAKYAEEL